VSSPGSPPTSLPSQMQVVLRLSELSRLLDNKTLEIPVLDEAWVRAKSSYRREFARVFLTTTGPVDVKKQTASQETADLELAMDIAEVQVRAAREAIRTLRDQLDVGRSMNAATRAQAQADGGTYVGA